MQIESKRLAGLCIILFLFLMASLCFNVRQWFTEKGLRYMLYDFAAVNHIPIEFQAAELKDIKKLSKQFGVPENLITAIGEHEQGIGSQQYGCQKISIWIQWRYPERLWQLAMCCEIVAHESMEYCKDNELFFKNDTEMMSYIAGHKKDFVFYLADRYNYKYRTIWADSVLKLWKKHIKERG